MDKSLSSKPRVCFEVEKVIGFTSEGNVRSYQVQWAPAWVSSYHLVGCEHLIKDFFQRQQSRVSDPKTQNPQSSVSQERDVEEVQIQNQSERECPSAGIQNNDIESRDNPLMVVAVEPDVENENDFELPAVTVKVENSEDINGDISNLDIHSDPIFSTLEESEENDMNPSSAEPLCTESPIKVEDSENNDQPEFATDAYSLEPYVNNTTSTYTPYTWNTSHNTEGPISMAHLNPIPPHQTTKEAKPKGFRSTTVRPKAINKYPCSVCDKRLPSKSQLEIHFRIHTGDKPFKCSYCPKAFAHSSNLKKHHRTHSGEKPFHCEVCGKCFTESTHLKRHSLTHSAAAEGPYVCPHCGVSYAHSAELEQHVLTSQCNGYI